MSKGKAIAVAAIKGGVGKTTTIVNIAHILANDHNKKVLVIDANFSSPNLNLHLGAIENDKSIHHLLNNNEKLHNVICEHSFGFHFIPTDITKLNSNQHKLKNIVNELKNHYDVILLDSAPSPKDEMLAAIDAADELYVVSTPDLPTLTSTLKTAKLARQNNTKVSGLILNKVKNKNYELKPESMEKLTGIKLVATIKDSVRVLESLNSIRPVSLLNPNSDVSLEYKKLAALMVNASYENPKWHIRALGYLKDDFKNLTTHKFSKGLSYFK